MCWQSACFLAKAVGFDVGITAGIHKQGLQERQVLPNATRHHQNPCSGAYDECAASHVCRLSFIMTLHGHPTAQNATSGRENSKLLALNMSPVSMSRGRESGNSCLTLPDIKIPGQVLKTGVCPCLPRLSSSLICHTQSQVSEVDGTLSHI